MKPVKLFFLFAFLPFLAGAQSYSSVEVNPWGLSTAPQRAQQTLVDIDGDGDLDIFLGNGSEMLNVDIQYYENTGTPESPAFGNPQANPFGLTATGSRTRLAFADLDNDGDQDLLIGQKLNEVEYFENTGDDTNPQFAAGVEDPFGFALPPGLQNVAPTFADMDADGDLDLLVAASSGSYYYFENEGNASAPQFGSSQENPFGVTGGGWSLVPVLVDVDADGDYDIMTGELYGDIAFEENTGSPNAPAFSGKVDNPFGYEGVLLNSYPSFGDLDGDGDLDLLVGTGDFATETGDFRYFENQMITGIFDHVRVANVEVYPNPVQDILHFQTDKQITRLELYDIRGVLLVQEMYPGNSMNLTTLHSGTYVLRIVVAEGHHKEQLILKL